MLHGHFHASDPTYLHCSRVLHIPKMDEPAVPVCCTLRLASLSSYLYMILQECVSLI